MHSTTSSQYNSLPFAWSEALLGTSPESAFATPSCCSRDDSGNERETEVVEEKEINEEEERQNREFDEFFRAVTTETTSSIADVGNHPEAEREEEELISSKCTSEKTSGTCDEDGGSTETPETDQPKKSDQDFHEKDSILRIENSEQKAEIDVDAMEPIIFDAGPESHPPEVMADCVKRDQDSGIETIQTTAGTDETHRYNCGESDKPKQWFDEETIDVLRMTTMDQIDEAIRETKSIKDMIEDQLKDHVRQQPDDPPPLFQKAIKMSEDSTLIFSVGFHSTPTVESSPSSSSPSSPICCQIGDEWYTPKVVPPVTRRLFDKDLTPLQELTTATYKAAMSALRELKDAIADDEADAWTMEEEEERERKRCVQERRRERRLSEDAKRRSVTRVFEAGYGYEWDAKPREKLNCPQIPEGTSEESESGGEEGIDWSHF